MLRNDLLFMTQITPAGEPSTTIAAAGELFRWASEQPGFVGADVLADSKDERSFWLAERWTSRALRDGARLDPVGARLLAEMEGSLDRDDAATYTCVSRFPSKGSAMLPAEGTSLLNPPRPAATVADQAPTIIIARFHLKPGRYDAFVAADEKHSKSLEGSGVIRVDLARHSDNANRLCHYELWHDAESRQAYVDSFERQRFLADAAALLVEPEPSVELRLLGRYLASDAARPMRDGLLVDPVDKARLSPEARKVLESAPPVPFFDLVGHAQAALPPLLRLMLALMAKQSALRPRLRLLAVLLVLSTKDVRYEWNRQLEPALAAGLSQNEIDAVVTGWRGSALFDREDRLVLRASAEALSLGRVSRETFSSLVEVLGPPSTVELLLNIGHFQSMGQLIVSSGLPADPKPDRADDRARER